jgi:hypothetical protein
LLPNPQNRPTEDFFMVFNAPIHAIIRNRFSCRGYLREPIDLSTHQKLCEACAEIKNGPRGSVLRFSLVASTDSGSNVLEGLGTYGFIKNPAGFLIGAVSPGKGDLEDFGFGLETIVLRATDLGLGTCWLGGSFAKRKFARRISASKGELVPAVVSCGRIGDPVRAKNMLVRRIAGSNFRLGRERLFFDESFAKVLSREAAGAYDVPLEMVRIGPSASNKQPWRIVRDRNNWHFFLQRTPGYPGGIATGLLKIADIQRVDMGIAMCHFECAARELGLQGRWVIEPPRLETPDNRTEYSVTWKCGRE